MLSPEQLGRPGKLQRTPGSSGGLRESSPAELPGRTGEDRKLSIVLPAESEAAIRFLAPDGHWAAGMSTQVRRQRPSAGQVAPAPQVFELAAPITIAGRVIHRVSRQPVSGALVWPAAQPLRVGRTDRRGRFSLQVPFASPPQLSAAASGYLGTVAELNARAQGEAELVLAPAGEVRGMLVDLAGQAVKSAEIQIAPAGIAKPLATGSSWSRSSPRGTFRIGGLKLGQSYWLRVTATGFVRARFTVPASTGFAQASHRLVLTPGRTGVGRVVDRAGNPVSGARVQSLSSTSFEDAESLLTAPETLVETTTDAQGRFGLPELPPGKVDLYVTAAGYAPTWVRVAGVPETQESADMGTVVLDAGASIAGRVVGSRREPLAGCEVHFIPVGPATVFQAQAPKDAGSAVQVTGKMGEFTISDLRLDEAIHLRAQCNGFAPGTLEVTPETAGAPVIITLKPAARIAGTLRDQDGKPVPGALVFASHPAEGSPQGKTRLQGGATRADEVGHFTLENLDPGRLQIKVIAAGYLQWAQEVDLLAGEPVEALEITLHAGAVVEGTVSDDQGLPVEGAQVQVENNGAAGAFGQMGLPTAVSDDQGQFRLTGVTPGTRAVVARHPAYVAARRQIEVGPRLDVLELQLRRGMEVSGRVVDGDGSPVAGAEVSLLATDGALASAPAVSSTEGAFRFNGIAPGTYRLLGEKTGFGTAQAPLELQGGNAPVPEVQLVLSPGGAIAGRILGLTQEQLQHVSVWASAAGWPGRAGRVEHDGHYRVSSVAPGEWTVTAHSPILRRDASGRAVVDVPEAEAALLVGDRN